MKNPNCPICKQKTTSIEELKMYQCNQNTKEHFALIISKTDWYWTLFLNNKTIRYTNSKDINNCHLTISDKDNVEIYKFPTKQTSLEDSKEYAMKKVNLIIFT